MVKAYVQQNVYILFGKSTKCFLNFHWVCNDVTWLNLLPRQHRICIYLCHQSVIMLALIQEKTRMYIDWLVVKDCWERNLMLSKNYLSNKLKLLGSFWSLHNTYNIICGIKICFVRGHHTAQGSFDCNWQSNLIIDACSSQFYLRRGELR